MEGRTMVVSTKRFASRTLRGVLALMVVLTGAFVLTGTANAEQTTIIVDGVECHRDAYGGPIVCPTDHRRFDPKVDADILERRGTPPDTLPFTGADVTLFLITGAALVATGMLVVRRTRAGKGEV